MKINCLSCDHKVDLDQVCDDYEGAVRCFACDATLHIRTEQGRLKSVDLVKGRAAAFVGARSQEAYARLARARHGRVQGDLLRMARGG